MKPKSTVNLDELDVKCLDELPVLLNVLSSTANKLTRIYNPLFDDLVDTIKAKKPKEWDLSKDLLRGVFYPFADDYKKDNIEILYAYLSVYYEVSIIPLASSGNDEVTLKMGLYYDAEDDELKRPCHYFELSRQVRRKASALHTRSYYQAMGEKVKNEKTDVRIYHPESGDMEEDITVLVYEHSVEVITEAFESFKAEVLLPFLQSLNTSVVQP